MRSTDLNSLRSRPVGRLTVVALTGVALAILAAIHAPQRAGAGEGERIPVRIEVEGIGPIPGALVDVCRRAGRGTDAWLHLAVSNESEIVSTSLSEAAFASPASVWVRGPGYPLICASGDADFGNPDRRRAEWDLQYVQQITRGTVRAEQTERGRQWRIEWRRPHQVVRAAFRVEPESGLRPVTIIDLQMWSRYRSRDDGVVVLVREVGQGAGYMALIDGGAPQLIRAEALRQDGPGAQGAVRVFECGEDRVLEGLVLGTPIESDEVGHLDVWAWDAESDVLIAHASSMGSPRFTLQGLGNRACVVVAQVAASDGRTWAGEWNGRPGDARIGVDVTALSSRYQSVSGGLPSIEVLGSVGSDRRLNLVEAVMTSRPGPVLNLAPRERRFVRPGIYLLRLETEEGQVLREIPCRVRDGVNLQVQV